MDVSVTEQQERVSDYGSDFTPDEEEILKDLLEQAPVELDNPYTDPDLQLKEIEDDKTPRGVRVRTLGHEPRAMQTPTKEKKRVTIQIDGDGGISANGSLRANLSDNTN